MYIFMIDTKSICTEWASRYVYQNLIDDKSTSGLVNGLVPSGTKPLPEPVLTTFCDTLSLP